jgi:DNA replication protein DnaD
MAKKKVVKKAKPAATTKSAKKGKTDPKKSSTAKKPAKRKAAKEPEVSLGRPLVTQEEKLYMLFQHDYHARQIFEFLRVNTLKELEELSPQQIVRRISKPVFDTVDRIRQKLAEMKRSLRDDEAYAKEYRDSH